jgi:selenocysteine lyase/cysteine desulfurase
VDAYQSVGQIPFSVHDAEVDFLSAGGLKWLLGGPGIVFLYVRGELCSELTPSVTGWFAHERQFDFDPRTVQWHRDARRFEQGTPSLSAVYAQLGGLDVVEELGVSAIHDVTRDLTEDLVRKADEAGLKPRVAPLAGERSAIVMVPRDDPATAVRKLSEAGIVVDARPGHVRISPYFYNIAEDHDAAIEILCA